jgi:hypothetical protein
MAAVSDITPVPSRPILLCLARSCEKEEVAFLQRGAEFFGRHTSHSPKSLGEMAGVRVAGLQGHLDQTARGFADELLGARD